MVQKHVITEYFATLNFTKNHLTVRSTEVSDKTIKNNVAYSFWDISNTRKWDFFQYRSYTVIKNMFESISKGFPYEI